MRTRLRRTRVAGARFFDVTAEHCERGCQKDAANCMIAQAVLENIPGATHVMCTLREIAWSNPKTKRRYRYFTPPSAAQAIRRFDAGESVNPFRLHLNDGVIFPIGWKAKHPGSTRQGKHYAKGGQRPVRYTRYRTFGANNIAQDES